MSNGDYVLGDFVLGDFVLGDFVPNPKKTLRLKKGFLTRLVILSLAIGRCVTAKNIDGLTIKNEVKRIHLLITTSNRAARII